MTDWYRTLTVVPDKATVFARETYAREAWADAVRTFGADAVARLQRTVVLILRPDAVVGRRIEPTLDFMHAHGFRPTASRLVPLSRHVSRAIWQYQWNKATLSRIAVTDLLTSAADSLWVAFQDTRDPLTLPAAARFRSLKGSSYPTVRLPHQLRFLLGGTNRLMTFVHSTDEPIDVVRELGILFDGEERRAVLDEMAAAATAAAATRLAARVHRVQSAHPPVDFDHEAALQRLVDAAQLAGGARADRNSDLHRLVTGIRAGRTIDWFEFERSVTRAGVDPPRWDRVQIGAQHVEHDLPGARCFIDDDGYQGWVAGAGRLSRPASVPVRHPEGSLDRA